MRKPDASPERSLSSEGSRLSAGGLGALSLSVLALGLPGALTSGPTAVAGEEHTPTPTVEPTPIPPQPLGDPIPGPIEEGFATVRLATVAKGLTAPLWGTHAPGEPRHLYVADQDGILWSIDLLDGQKIVFADFSHLLVDLGVGGPGTFDERGFLGFAFHPDYQRNGLVYTYTSEPFDGPADYSTMPEGVAPNHQTVIREWLVVDAGEAGAKVDMTTWREVLRIDQPQFNHNGGTLAFGPDGMLYISLGDGGGADDQNGQPFAGTTVVGHPGAGNGQNASNPLGAILRIDPLGEDSHNGQYGIPVDNPFVLDDERLDEIFAYGFRNPYRMSFDRMTGMLYTGDVGQENIEEVNLVVWGGNYGWNIKEGDFAFYTNGDSPGYVAPPTTALPGDLIDPIAQYDHDEGIAVVGGFVYRGSDIPILRGKYVFGDFLSPDQDSPQSESGRLFYLAHGEIKELRLWDQEEVGLSILGFGEDARGELYVLANETGTPFGDTGVVLRIAPILPKRPGVLPGDRGVGTGPDLDVDLHLDPHVNLSLGRDRMDVNVDVHVNPDPQVGQGQMLERPRDPVTPVRPIVDVDLRPFVGPGSGDADRPSPDPVRPIVDMDLRPFVGPGSGDADRPNADPVRPIVDVDLRPVVGPGSDR